MWTQPGPMGPTGLPAAVQQRTAPPRIDFLTRPLPAAAEAPVPAVALAPRAVPGGTDPPTIFHEPWWLAAATGGQVERVEVRSSGRLVAWLPYWTRRRRGFQISLQPPLTHLLGPVIDAGKGSGNNQWLHRIDAMEELAGALPRLALFSQTCHPGLPDVLGFQARGYVASVQFSAEIAPGPEDTLWKAMRDKTRNVIRKADKRWRVDEVADPGWFRRLYADHLARSGRESYFDLHHIDSLYEAARQRGQAAIRRSVDDAGQVAAAVFTVWDQHRAWYLMSTRDPAVSDNGAVSQLLWHCIRDAAARGLVFDFDGISSPGTARFYAGFGATMGPRYSVSRASTGYQLAMAARDWVRGRPARNAFTAP